MESLAAGLEGEQGGEAVRVSEAIRQCTQILECVAWVDRYRTCDRPLEMTDLDRAIRDGITRHPDILVRYDGTTERVLADGLLSLVFANLLGDVWRYGGEGPGSTAASWSRPGTARCRSRSRMAVPASRTVIRRNSLCVRPGTGAPRIGRASASP